MAGHKTTHNQTERYILIDKILSEGTCPTFNQLLQTLRIELEDKKLSSATVRRDIKYMQVSLNAPIKYNRLDNCYYYEKPFNFPLNNFSSVDIQRIALLKKIIMQYGSTDPVYKSIYDFLTKLSPASEKEISQITKRIVVSKRPKAIINNKILILLFEAIKCNCLCDFIYQSKWEPGKNHRRYLPYQLVIDEGQFYLYAADVKEPDMPRLFNINRIQNLVLQRDKTFTLPENYKFEESFEEGRFGAFQYDEAYSFKIEIYGESRNFLHERIWADNQIIEESNSENKSIITFTSSQWIPIEKWILSFGGDAKPLEPDWLVEWWKAEIHKMVKRQSDIELP